MRKFETIFCDLDGPLANFPLEAVRAHLRAGRRIRHLTHYGTPLELTEKILMSQWPRGMSVHEYILPETAGVTDYWSDAMQAFWKPINVDPLFWHNMAFFSHAFELIELLKGYCKHLVILTTPHWTTDCYAGKRECLIKKGLSNLELIYCHHKWRLADPDSLLIDDFSRHTSSWVTTCDKRFGCPGMAILHPGVWNENYENAADPVGYIEKRIKALLGE